LPAQQLWCGRNGCTQFLCDRARKARSHDRIGEVPADMEEGRRAVADHTRRQLRPSSRALEQVRLRKGGAPSRRCAILLHWHRVRWVSRSLNPTYVNEAALDPVLGGGTVGNADS